MVWEDQGLYFTLAFNAIAMTVCIIVAFVLHKPEANTRIMRPRRPFSTMGAFFQFPKSLFTLNEDEVGESVGVEGAIYCLLLKFCAGFMLSCFIGTIIIVSICATDTYLNDFRQETDPNDCKDQYHVDDCEDIVFCEWTYGPDTSTVGNSSFIVCEPKRRQGLFDFSVQNITPEKWTMWLYAIACLLSAIQMLVFLHYLCVALKNLFHKAYVKPIMIPDSFAERPGSDADKKNQKRHKQGRTDNYSAFATIGARTVLVAGFFDPSDEEDETILKDRQAVLDKFRKSTLPFGLDRELRKKEEEDEKDKKMKDETKKKNAEDRNKEREEKIKPDPTAELTTYIVPDSIVMIREPPKKMLDLMEEEKVALEVLANDVAAEQQEEDEEKLPHTKRVPPVCCKAVPSIEHDEKVLEKIREDLAELVEEVPEQDFVGSVLMTFDTPLHALQFVETFNKNHAGAISKRMASMVGPKDGVIWDNLAVSGAAANVRWFGMIILLIVLTFFWGIPVAFLGSLENLATLPVIGGPFAVLIDAIPGPILGILTAYLPTIVLTVFNILLPVMMRGFSRVGGAQSATSQDSAVLSLYFFFTVMSGIIIQAAIQGGLGQLASLIANPTQESIFAFILAIVSPSGGYWYSFLITAACLGTYRKLLVLVPFILSKVFVKAKLVGNQEAYDALFAPRLSDYPVFLAVHLFFFALAMLFHTTVPFLVPFGFLYFVNAYLVERALLLDGGAQQTNFNVDFTLAKGFLGIVLWLHTIASMGTVVVSVLKLHIPAIVIASLALLVSIIMQVRMRSAMNPLVTPTVALYEELTKEAVDQAQAASENEPTATAIAVEPQPAALPDDKEGSTAAKDASAAPVDTDDVVAAPPAITVPGIGKLEPFTVNDHGYEPSYSFYKIDQEAVANIKGKDYAIDCQWYHKEGKDAAPIPFKEEEEEEEEEKENNEGGDDKKVEEKHEEEKKVDSDVDQQDPPAGGDKKDDSAPATEQKSEPEATANTEPVQTE